MMETAGGDGRQAESGWWVQNDGRTGTEIRAGERSQHPREQQPAW